MTDPVRFNAASDRSDPLASVVTVVGEVDLATAPTLADHLRQAADGGEAVVVDLTGCTFIDSSGFRVLHEAAATTPTVLVVPSGSPVTRAMAIAGLERLVPMVEDVESAKRHLKSGAPG